MKIPSTFAIALYWVVSTGLGQNLDISGKVVSREGPVPFASVVLLPSSLGSATDSTGAYKIYNVKPGSYMLRVSFIGYKTFEKPIHVSSATANIADIVMEENGTQLQEIVVTGTLKKVNRLESPVPVEVYYPSFFKKNPTPNIFEALQTVNGVRPQLNCNVCNTGDIHINGLEGPYTMVLIDGMPIVSSLSTVYGLSGIPNAMVERIEIIKGPASSLYGSEAVGGLINIITKKPVAAPTLLVDMFGTSWLEKNIDISVKLKVGEKAISLTGINYFNFNNLVDNNKDGFTDLTLQNRISIFQKWSMSRKDNLPFNVAGRYFYEDRWGGDTRWTKAFRGGDTIYGESIYTKRWEFLGNYQLPVREKILISFSYNNHNQDSRYGTTSYIAQQNIAFSQLTWDKKISAHDFLAGAALRYTFYDDNTPATQITDTVGLSSRAQRTWLPGVFIQDEITLAQQHHLLFGFRYDYNSTHGNIYTPRFAYRWTLNENNILRLNAGTGYRVVNLFTEDHAALTGARTVIIKEELRPERSYNINLNYVRNMFVGNGNFLSFDVAAWYTYFDNRIFGDYESDPNNIIYHNLKGHAITSGITGNLDFTFNNGLKILAGATYMDVYYVENNDFGTAEKQRQILTEHWTGTWAASCPITALNLTFDYTGNFYGPMRLPLLGPLDPRKAYSPWWSIQNIQFTWENKRGLQVYGGVKNLLNWTPNRGNPFIIARTNDPFDKEVQYDASGNVLATPDNPYALTFDTSYVYGPNQGIRGFLGIRLTLQ
ncbi:MAG: TonB-dependent receptor [Cyclobacteriaceae bacterium]|nr:TonB-dependent receptor [Cyclobacteriaceae bacterium]MDH4297632.1 TonB-dependent receptor [Cyclobacteriaceae bacterium]MDH5251291.1 TonB-dependent receptor [Cyclobacteriaceae bacterium]